MNSRQLGAQLLSLAALGGLSAFTVWNGLIWFTRFRTRGLASRPNPARDYQEALERLEQLQALDDARVNPVCRTRALLHGQKADRTIVFIHGMTSCPQQFAPLGQHFFDRGYNVLLARMPRHGFQDRATHELKHLRAEELCLFADRIVDVAAGLGDHVTVAGLSGGGIVAAWAAQHREELDQAVFISPFMGIGRHRRSLQLLLAHLLMALPNLATHQLRPFADAAPYGYLGHSSRSLGEVQRLGLATAFAALKQRPSARRVLLVTNAADRSVNNPLARQLVHAWQERGIQQVEFYEFPEEQGLHHDLIDPHHPAQQVGKVYPVLLDLIDRR